MKYLIPILILLFSSNVSAAWYQVELIVFEHLIADDSGELWYGNQGLPDITNTIELIRDGETEINSDTDTAFHILPKKEFKLEGVYRNLKFSKNYRPLLHTAWLQQEIGSKVKAKYVHLRLAEVMNMRKPIFNQQDIDGNEISGEIAEEELNTDDNPMQDALVKLDGKIRLRVGHLLHLDIDLAYFFQSTYASLIDAMQEDPAQEQKIYNFSRLKETRKIRLNELHYFDHPLFGAIVWVKRLEKKR